MGSEMSSFERDLALAGALHFVEWNSLILKDYPRFSTRHVSIQDMPEFAAKFEDVIIENIKSYRYASDANDLFSANRQSYNHRRFLVVDTSHGLFCFEQGNKCINVKYCRKYSDIITYPGGDVRILSEFWKNEKNSRNANLSEIFYWIYLNNEFKESSFFSYCTIS